MTPPTDPRRSDGKSGSEHAEALAEVLEDQKRRQEGRETKERGKSSDTSFFVQVGLLVSGTFFFYLLFFSPTWVAPEPAPEIAAERSEDNLRFYLFMVARQVDAFRNERGRLPETADEIPGVKSGTEYVRLSPRDYRIRFSAGDVSVTYESSQDPGDFLGDSGEAVLGGGSRSESRGGSP